MGVVAPFPFSGGQVAFDERKDKFTENYYGLGINTQRYELFGKLGYVFPQQKYKSIGLQLSATNFQQASYFGLTNYKAKQQSIYTNLIYQSIINSTITGTINQAANEIVQNRTGGLNKIVVPTANSQSTTTQAQQRNLP